jgi:hypothetical protein
VVRCDPMRPSFGVPKLSKSKVACDTLNGRDFVWTNLLIIHLVRNWGLLALFGDYFMKNLL